MYKSEPIFLRPKNISSTFSQNKLDPLSHISCTWWLKCLSIPSPITWLYSSSMPYYFHSKTYLSVSSLSIPPSHCFFWLWHLNLTLLLGVLGTSITLLSTRGLCVYLFPISFLFTLRAQCNLNLTFYLYLMYTQVRQCEWNCVSSPHSHKTRDSLFCHFS